MYYDGENFETVAIAGLQIEIISMLTNRALKYVTIVKDDAKQINIRFSDKTSDCSA